jgi:hypothetical protein
VAVGVRYSGEFRYGCARGYRCWRRYGVESALRFASRLNFDGRTADLRNDIPCCAARSLRASALVAPLVDEGNLLDVASFFSMRGATGHHLARRQRLPELLQLPRLRSAGSELPLRALPTKWLRRLQRWMRELRLRFGLLQLRMQRMQHGRRLYRDERRRDDGADGARGHDTGAANSADAADATRHWLALAIRSRIGGWLGLGGSARLVFRRWHWADCSGLGLRT